jgi:hypothetical protein
MPFLSTLCKIFNINIIPSQAWISLRAGGCSPGPGAVGGPNWRTFAGIQNFACGANFLNTCWVAISRKFTIGPFYPKISPNFYSYACPGGPKSKQPGARKDLNPALFLAMSFLDMYGHPDDA